MPAQSEKERELMAIAEHHPEKVYARNRGVLAMTHSQLHDFASTKGLHKRIGTRPYGRSQKGGQDGATHSSS